MADLLPLSGWLSYGSFFLVFACSFAIIVLGLNLQWGFTGLFNVGVAGFVAVGAYTSAILTTPTDGRTIRRLRLAGGRRLAGGDGRVGAGRAAGRRGGAAPARRLPGHHHLRRRGDDPAGGDERATPDRRPFRRAVHPQAAAGLARHRAAVDAGLPGTDAGAAGRRLSGAGEAGAQPLGPRAARHPRGRRRGSIAGQARVLLPPAELRHRQRADGPGRRGLRALRRLHRARGLPADPDLPAVGHADRRRLGQQPRRHARRLRRLGLLDRRRRPAARPGAAGRAGARRRAAGGADRRADRADAGAAAARPARRGRWPSRACAEPDRTIPGHDDASRPPGARCATRRFAGCGKAARCTSSPMRCRPWPRPG